MALDFLMGVTTGETSGELEVPLDDDDDDDDEEEDDDDDDPLWSFGCGFGFGLWTDDDELSSRRNLASS